MATYDSSSNGSTSNNMASDGTDFNVGDSNFRASEGASFQTCRAINKAWRNTTIN